MSADVVIVGGGPAGAAAAIVLARAGREVLVLERARFPREKPCGDCLNPGAVAELRSLGVAEGLREQLRPVALHGWRIEAPDGSAFTGGFDGNGGSDSPRGWAVRRRELDAALLGMAERAGARVRFGYRAFDLLRERDRVVGVRARSGARVTEFRAPWTLGADGLRSVVRRRLGSGTRRPRRRKIALVTHIAAATGDPARGELRVRHGRCVGYAPLGSEANLTLVVPVRAARAMGGDPEGFLEAALRGFPVLRSRAFGAGPDGPVMVTGPFDQPVRRVAVPGALLAGDAAGYFDPFTGQGICQGLRTGRAAAQAIGRALEEPGSAGEALRRYERDLRGWYRRTHALQRLIDAIIRRPALMSYFVRRLASDGRAATRLLRATGDLEGPLSVLDPRMLFRTLLPRG